MFLQNSKKRTISHLDISHSFWWWLSDMLIWARYSSSSDGGTWNRFKFEFLLDSILKYYDLIEIPLGEFKFPFPKNPINFDNIHELFPLINLFPVIHSQLAKVSCYLLHAQLHVLLFGLFELGKHHIVVEITQPRVDRVEVAGDDGLKVG